MIFGGVGFPWGSKGISSALGLRETRPVVSGTPYQERVIEGNRLQGAYTREPDLFYQRSDAFSTMIKHPTPRNLLIVLRYQNTSHKVLGGLDGQLYILNSL